MNPAPPGPPPMDPAWNEAYHRVDSYLRAHRITHPLALNRLVAAIIGRAWAAGGAHPHENRVALALREADTVITDWFAGVLAQHGPHSRRLGVRGRLALALADVPGRWPANFLVAEVPPPELADRMREAILHTGPLPGLRKMTPRPLELGWFAGAMDWLWLVVQHSAILRVVRRGLVVAAVVGLGWLACFR